MAERTGVAEREIAERELVLRRFRKLLVAQRDKFQNYLEVLERERSDIESGDVDALVSHVEIEQAIVAEIFTFQKVIDPLEDMYRAAYPAADMPADIPDIKAKLDDLKTEVAGRNAENRALLKQRMSMLRQEIQGLRNPFKKANRVYSGDDPSHVDLKG